MLAAQPEPAAALASPPPLPSPRQRLIAAEQLACGEPLSVAALRAGLEPEQLEQLRDTSPAFQTLLADCESRLAQPQAEQDERLRQLTRCALERALADGRVGAIPAALRLLGLLPTRPGPTSGGKRKDRDEADRSPYDLAPPAGATLGERWGMWPDGAGGWRGPDGKPALPGRPT